MAKDVAIGSFVSDMERHIVQPKSSPQVVIVGGGFGGLTAAKELAGKGVRVTALRRFGRRDI